MTIVKNNKKRAPLGDTEIVELYWARDEMALEETDLKYRKYLFSIAYNIVHDALDCEECLNDTYFGAWNSMPPSRPNILKAFLTVIMRRRSVNRYHKNSQKNKVPSEMTVSLSELENFLTEGDDIDSELDAERLGRVISDFIRSLPERRRFIFMSRYYSAEPIEIIARALGMSRSTVNKELAAIKALLKEILEKEGYSL